LCAGRIDLRRHPTDKFGALVIRDGQSGYLVPRSNSLDDDADNLARKLLNTHDLVASRRMDPVHIASHIDDFTPRTQLARVFRLHRDIQDAKRTSGVPPTSEP
jgi:hypothetical protein